MKIKDLSWLLVFCIIATFSLVGSATAESSWGRGSTVLYGIDSSTGEVVPLKVSGGALESTAEITGDVSLGAASLLVLDDGGDTLQVSDEGYGLMQIAGDSIGLAKDATLSDTLVREIYAGETLPMKVTNQDTDVVNEPKSLSFVRSDSVTLGTPGDTAELTYSPNVDKVAIWSYGGIVNYRPDLADATNADQASSNQARTELTSIDISTLNLHSYGRNSGSIEVHVSAWRYE